MPAKGSPPPQGDKPRGSKTPMHLMTLVTVVVVAGIALYQLTKWQRKWVHDHVLNNGGTIQRLRQDEAIYSVDLSNCEAEVDVEYVNSYFPIVNLRAAPSTNDDGLAAMVGMELLKELNLSDSQVTDAGMDSVARLKNLELLILERTRVTDAGIAKLAPLENLETLDLSGLPVGPAGLEQIAKLPNLKELQLDNTGLTDQAIAPLSGLPTVRNLDLGRNELTDAGLAHLSELFTLTELRLDHARVTSDGLAHLGKLKLKRLALNNTRVDDNGLQHLMMMASLDQIERDGTGITQRGIEQMRAEQAKRSQLVGIFKVEKGGAPTAFFGFAGRDEDGTELRGGLEVSTGSEKAQASGPTSPGVVTELTWNGEAGSYAHSQLPLGEFATFMRMGDFYDCRWVRVDGAARQIRKDYIINPTNAASIEIIVPDGVGRLTFFPLKRYKENDTNEDFPAQLGIPVAVEDGKVALRLMPGTYHFGVGDQVERVTLRSRGKIKLNLAE